MRAGGAADPELDELQRRGTRLGVGALLGIGLVALFTVVVATGVVIREIAKDAPTQPRIERDAHELQVTRDRLANINADLTAIPSPIGASHSTSTGSADCYDQSGGVGQPWVGRSWTVQSADADRIIATVAGALTDRGWSDSSVTGNIVERKLRRSWGDWSGEVSIGRSYKQDEVWITGSVSGAVPCRLASNSSS